MPTIHVKSMEEFVQLTSSSKVTMVDFYATWCGPCVFVAPRIEQLSNDYPTIQFLKVDVDELNDVSSKCEIRAMPTFQFYQNGQKMREDIVGANMDAIMEFIEKNK
ncbi:thioredoxin [Globomyces pollinis-pini]|nr:thioredoxin [Globomyces pollinis-pini]